jgi:hypothetical protein
MLQLFAVQFTIHNFNEAQELSNVVWSKVAVKGKVLKFLHLEKVNGCG